MPIIGALGLIAGAITTVTGVGGGLLLLVVLALLFDPATALAITAPGLLAGNLHRLFMFRRSLDLGLAARLALGALPGAALGGALAAGLSEGTLRVVILLAAGLAVARALNWVRWNPPRGALVPVGALAGALTAAGGGGGILIPPALLALGLRGPAYLATTAAASAAIHVGRLSAYGVAGWMNETRWWQAGLLALTIPLGNLIGRAVRDRLGERTIDFATHAALVVVCVLAVIGARPS